MNLQLSITRDTEKQKSLLLLLRSESFKKLDSILIFATHKRTCDQLAARIDDWQGIQEHHHFVERLRQRHAAQWHFWALLDR